METLQIKKANDEMNSAEEIAKSLSIGFDIDVEAMMSSSYKQALIGNEFYVELDGCEIVIENFKKMYNESN